MSASVTALKPPMERQGEIPRRRTGSSLVGGATLRPKASRAMTAPPAEERNVAAPTPQARYDLRATVRYRVAGKARTGVVIGITHGDPLQYDIVQERRAKAKSKRALLISYYVPHEAIDGMLAPPPADQSILVLEDLPPEPLPVLAGR